MEQPFGVEPGGNRNRQPGRVDQVGRRIRQWTTYITAAVFLAGGAKAVSDHMDNSKNMPASSAQGLNYQPQAGSKMPQNPEILNLHSKELVEALSKGELSEAGKEVLKKLVNTLTLKFEAPLSHDGTISVDLPMDWARDYIHTNISDPAEAQKLMEVANTIISELMTQVLAGPGFVKDAYTHGGKFDAEAFVRDIQKISITGSASAEGNKDEDLTSATQPENIELAKKRAEIVREALLKSGIKGIERVPVEILAEKDVLDQATYAAIKSMADQEGLSMTELIMRWNAIKTQDPNIALEGDAEKLYKLFENERKVRIEIELKGGKKEHILIPLPLLLLLLPATLALLRGIKLPGMPEMDFRLPTFRFPEIKLPQFPKITLPDIGFIFSKGRYTEQAREATVNIFQQILGQINTEKEISRPSGVVIVNGKPAIDLLSFLPNSLAWTTTQKLRTSEQILDHVRSLQLEGVEEIDPALFIQAVSEVMIDVIRENAEAFQRELEVDSNLTFAGKNVETPGTSNYNESKRASTLSIVSMETIVEKYLSLTGRKQE